MLHITFDTLKCTKDLEKSGIPRVQAEAMIYAQQGILTDCIEDMHDILATKGDIIDLRDDTRQEIASLREETQKEFTAVRGEIAELREEMRQEFTAVRGEIAELRLETRSDIVELRGEVVSLELRMKDFILKVAIILGGLTTAGFAFLGAIKFFG